MPLEIKDSAGNLVFSIVEAEICSSSVPENIQLKGSAALSSGSSSFDVTKPLKEMEDMVRRMPSIIITSRPTIPSFNLVSLHAALCKAVKQLPASAKLADAMADTKEVQKVAVGRFPGDAALKKSLAASPAEVTEL